MSQYVVPVAAVSNLMVCQGQHVSAGQAIGRAHGPAGEFARAKEPGTVRTILFDDRADPHAFLVVIARD